MDKADDIPCVHCCELMDDFIKDTRIPIDYRPRFREYYIPLKRSGAIQCLFFCPWCGTKLPKSLRKAWCNKLRSLGFEDPFDDDIPDEYKSDIWWRQRENK